MTAAPPRWLALALCGCVALSLASCRRADGARPARPRTSELLAAGGAVDPAASLLALERIVSRVREERKQKPVDTMLAVLNRVVFEHLGFAREIDDQDPRFMLLPSVLDLRRGSCVGLGTLYLALGEWLGLPIAGVVVPGHFFVRVTDEGGVHNVELLRGGEDMPDDFYRGKYHVPLAGAPAYLRPLAHSEVLGVVSYNLGNDLRRRGRLAEARDAYARATASFPAFAEAHASLGLVLQLQGDLSGAEHAYAAARAANPDLPGLEQNLKVLEKERQGGVE